MFCTQCKRGDGEGRRSDGRVRVRLRVRLGSQVNESRKFSVTCTIEHIFFDLSKSYTSMINAGHTIVRNAGGEAKGGVGGL